jgi:hypothetical protein
MAAPDDPPERRVTDRLDILGDLHGEIMVFQPMNVRAISASGVQVETRVALQVNSLHELRLTLGPHSVIVRGRVVHCSISDVGQEQIVYRSGLEFIEPTAHVDAVIAGFLSAVHTARGRQ